MQYGKVQLLQPAEAEGYRAALDAQDWQTGQARTEKLTGTIKRNKELKPGQDGDLVTSLSTDITKKIASCPDFAIPTMMKTMTAVKFNKYGDDEPGGEYKRHTDAPWMGPVRTDFTVVLALTDPDEYEGGDHWVTPPNGDPMVFRLNQGELLFYETGYAHWVEPVTKGSRISALSWAETSIQGERNRAITRTLLNLSREFEANMQNEELADEVRSDFRRWFVDVGVVHSGLHRIWSSK